MTRHYDTIDQYFEGEPRVSVQTMQMNGLVVSSLDETSNDISIASTNMHSVLLSITGSSYHNVRIGDKVQKSPTRPGDVSLIPSGVNLRSEWRTKGSALRTISLEFNTDLFKVFTPEIFSEKFSKGHLVPSNYSPRAGLASLTTLLKREMDGSARMGTIYRDGVIRLLALEIAAHGWTMRSVMPSYRNFPDSRICRAIDYIETCYKKDISLLDIANASGLSLTHLINLFRDKTGMTPHSYLLERRVQFATQLLRTTCMPIAQVAVEAGFSDQQHLTRVVHARRGQTPNAIRMDNIA
jgi:AraC family transcriptional regulator